MFTVRRVLQSALLAAIVGASHALDLNGWYPCSSSTFGGDGGEETESSTSGGLVAECAIFKAPLCYPGICNDANNQTVEIFVKRINAEDPAGKPNVWFMQGGPGAASPAMESAMTSINALLNGNVNVYTMDHRGTGRSTKLDCTAAQAQTSGSPSGASIDPKEAGSCAAELERRYGSDLASFSVTSAASDLDYFISNELKGSESYVYGVSYGTALVERLIHLNTTEIKSYILDGIATTSGAKLEHFEYFSTWDPDYDEVGQRFLASCEQNQEDCGKYFKDKSLSATLKDLIAQLDAKTSPCMDVLVNGLGTEADQAGAQLRMIMGSLLADATTRTFIPVLTYRLNRCNSDDQQVVAHFFASLAAFNAAGGGGEDFFSSDLQYKIIVYSEMWETPTPSFEEMATRFLKTSMSSGSFVEVASYCALTKEKSPSCVDFAEEQNYNASPISYKRDQYWNVAAELPADKSVLLMSSKMDPQTPHKYAEYLLDAIKAENKELVTFEHATHATLWTTPMSDAPDARVCGMELVASFVKNSGDLSKMDKSCVAQMPPINLKVREDLVGDWLNTTAPFDGAYAGTAGGDKDGGSSKYKTAFFVFVGLLVVALGVVGVLFYKWRSAQTRAGPSTPPFVAAGDTQA